jgi:hypothetical protein
MSDVVGAAKERLQRALRGRADQEAACVTLVAGSTVGEVLHAFGADPDRPPVDPSEVPSGIPAVAVAEVRGGVVAIEDNGFQGSAPVVLRLASARGRAASIYWNQNADMALGLAEAGVVTGPGEGILTGELGDDPAELALFHGLGDPDDDSWLTDVEVRGLVAAERFTGVRLDAPPADPRAAVHVVLARLDDHIRLSRDAMAFLRVPGGGDDLQEAVLGATPEKLRHMAAWAARLVLVRAGVEGHPTLATAMATLERLEGPVLGREADLLIRRSLQRPDGERIPPAGPALRVLHLAANPDPFTAAIQALQYAQRTLRGADADAFVDAALREARG